MNAKQLFILFALLYFSTISYAGDSIRVVSTHWPPYTNEAAPTDFTREVMNQAFALSGIKTKVSFIPWKRALDDAEKGRYDAIAPIYSSPARLDALLFSAPLYGSELILLRKKQSEQDTHIKDKIFGVVRGYSNSDWIDNTTDIVKTYAKNDTHNLALLEKNRIDICVIERRVAETILNSQGKNIDDYLVSSSAIEFKPFYIAFPLINPNSKDLVSAFNSGFIQLMLNGRLKQISDEYLK